MEHLVARLAWDRFEPGRMPEIAALLDAMAARDARPGGHALAEWSENLPLPERAYFETRFLRAADLIVTGRGARAARKMLNQVDRRRRTAHRGDAAQEISGPRRLAGDELPERGRRRGCRPAAGLELKRSLG